MRGVPLYAIAHQHTESLRTVWSGPGDAAVTVTHHHHSPSLLPPLVSPPLFFSP